MLKLPLTLFAVFSLFSSLASAEVNPPQRDGGTPVAGVSQGDDTPSAVVTAGIVTVPNQGLTLAAEGHLVDHLYLGGMFTIYAKNEVWVLAGPRISYHVELGPFTVAPLAGVVGVWAGRLSNDEPGKSAETVTVLGGAQLSAHVGPVLVGVEGTIMPVHTTHSESDYLDERPPDEQRWEAVATVSAIAGARF